MKVLFFIFLIFNALNFSSFNVLAVDKNATAFNNPEQETQFRELIKELRCMVCPNQPLSDSEASLAQDLRDQVREMVVQGQDNAEIKAFLVARYGDMVLYRPPVQPNTWVLWFSPILLLLMAGGVMLYFVRRHAQVTQSEPPTLNPAEQDKLKKILEE